MDALAYNKNLIAFESTSVLSNAEVSDYVEDTLRKLDFQTERIEYDDKNGVRKVNIVGKKGKGVGGMAHFGHTDVVPADDWLFEDHGPYTPTVVDDRLYGRGSCDMKGSIACMFAAVEQFSAQDLKQPVYITCTADEEIGYGGAQQVVKRSEFYREMVNGNTHAVIGEPTLLNVVYAHKGCYAIHAVSHGKAAHSSTSEGLNANLAMIPFLAEVKKIHDETEADPAWQNSEFDPPTLSLNIGINDHTRACNIKPPQSICTVYLRPMPGMDVEVLVNRARSVAEANGLEFHTPYVSGPLYTDPNSEYVQETLRLCKQSKAKTVAYGTDGAMFTELKNILVLGPGDIAQAHTHDEWISLEQLERGTTLFADLIRRWCC